MSTELDRQVLEAQAAISRYGAKVTKFSFNTNEPQWANLRQVDVEARDQIDGTTLWSVRGPMGRIISRRGTIRLQEPMPSSRSEWFLKTFRFDNQDEALRVAALWARELRKWVPNQNRQPERIRLPWRRTAGVWPTVDAYERGVPDDDALFEREYQARWT